LDFCGVVCNNAGSESHAALLREVMAASLPGTRLWGVLPRRADLAMPSRHLGLVTAGDDAQEIARLDALADWLEAAMDLDALLAALPPSPHPGGPGGMIPPGGEVQERQRLSWPPEAHAWAWPGMRRFVFIMPRICACSRRRD
jgi:cobyrinic acid a,c-diamide synthase